MTMAPKRALVGAYMPAIARAPPPPGPSRPAHGRRHNPTRRPPPWRAPGITPL